MGNPPGSSVVDRIGNIDWEKVSLYILVGVVFILPTFVLRSCDPSEDDAVTYTSDEINSEPATRVLISNERAISTTHTARVDIAAPNYFVARHIESGDLYQGILTEPELGSFEELKYTKSITMSPGTLLLLENTAEAEIASVEDGATVVYTYTDEAIKQAMVGTYILGIAISLMLFFIGMLMLENL